MSFWKEFAGAPEQMEWTDQRSTPWGGTEYRRLRIRSTACPLPAADRPYVWDDGPVRLARPWAPEPVEERAMTPGEVVAQVDAWCARERRPPVPERPARRGRRRRGERGGGGLYLGVAWWS